MNVHVHVTCSYLVATSSAMTDQERDEIDAAAQEFIQSCSKKIETLKQKGTCMHLCIILTILHTHSVIATQTGQQVKVHRQAVYESLAEYLKGRFI